MPTRFIRTASFTALITALGLTQTLAGDPVTGREKANQCQVCHGIDGIGKNPEVPNIAGEGIIYLIRQLRAFRSGERKHPQMSIIAAGLSDEDMSDIAAYYTSIKVSVELPKLR